MDNSSIILIIVIVVFQLIILYGIISSVIDLFKSIRYKSIKALVIDSVILGSKEWGKYFPEEYDKTTNIGSKIENFSNKLNEVDKIINRIPFIHISKNSVSINKRQITDNKIEKADDTYTMIAEYTVDNKIYYYCESFINESRSNNPFKSMIGKEIEIKYNPNNPKKSVRKNSNIKGIILLVVMELIFGLISLLLLNN